MENQKKGEIHMKKILFALFSLAFMLVVVACGNNDDTPATPSAPVAPAPGGNETVEPGETLSDQVLAYISQFGLPEPRFIPQADTPSWMLDTDFDAELTWYVNYIWWPATEPGDRWVTDFIMDEMNVRITWTSGNDEALNAMLASGNLPDIITFGGYNVSLVNDAYMFALPLDVLAAVYDPHFLDIVHPQIQAWMRLDNGHFYGIPNESLNSDEINAGYAFPGAGFLVRQDIYEAIGRPDMTTPEGFLQALRDAQTYMPYDDHGRPLVPFSGDFMNITTNDNGAFSGVLQDFLAIPTTVNGQWYDRDANPEYLAWLLVMRQAFEEGLISPEQFSLDNEGVNNEFETGRYFAVMTGNTNDFSSRMNNISTNNPTQQYIAISGPRNSAGDPHTFPAGAINGWTHTFITQSARDPQTAMQVLTYFWSDHGQMIQQFGLEGEHFEYVDGTPVWFDEIQDFISADYYGFRDVWGMRTFWQLRRPGFFTGLGVVPTGPHAEVQLHNRQFNQARLDFINLEPTEGQLERDLENIDLNRSRAIADVLTASSDEEATQIWQNFLESRYNGDWNGIIEHRNNRLIINRERLGL